MKKRERKIKGGGRVKRPWSFGERQNTKLKEKLPISLTLFLCLCHSKETNQARGIWHFIGGWYEYNGIKNIFLVGAREGKYESPSVY